MWGGSVVALHCQSDLSDTTYQYLDQTTNDTLTSTLEDYNYNFDYSAITTTIDGTASIDKVEFSNNIYDGNFAGSSEGLIDIIRIFRIYF